MYLTPTIAVKTMSQEWEEGRCFRELICLSKSVFKDTSADFKENHKLRLIEHEWGFTLMQDEKKFVLLFTFWNYTPEIEYRNFSSIQDYNDILFLLWYLIVLSYRDFSRKSNPELMDETEESRELYLKTMWEGIFAGLESHCHELLSGSKEDLANFRSYHAFILESVKEHLQIKLN